MKDYYYELIKTMWLCRNKWPLSNRNNYLKQFNYSMTEEYLKSNTCMQIICIELEYLMSLTTQSAGPVEYTDSISAGVWLPPYGCPWYDTKQSNVDAPVMLELWGMWNTPSLPSFPGQLWPRVVAPGRVPSMGQIELFDI